MRQTRTLLSGIPEICEISVERHVYNVFRQLGEFSRRDLSVIFLEKSCSANDGKSTWLPSKDIIVENPN